MLDEAIIEARRLAANLHGIAPGIAHSAYQRAYAIKRRKELWVMRHPESQTEVGGQSVPTHLYKDASGRAKTIQQSKQFAADTAERTGQSKRSINEHISRADALGDDLQALTGTSLDKGVELDALKVLPPLKRPPLIGACTAFALS